MPAPRETIDTAIAKVAAYCEQRSTDDYRIEHTVRGSSVTILERRPPWNPAYGSEWSSLKVAQLRYDERDRWHPYESAAPAPDIAPLLQEIDDDRIGIFWG
jgi:Protein of unknown function (DUF3024)